MPQSLSNILVHVVFSTRDRVPLLTGECPSIQIGGRSDHIHLLFRLSRTTPVANIIKEFKTSTTKWLKPQHGSLASFSWQAGYFAFSVSPRDVEMVRTYILSQEQHHQPHTF